MNRTGRRSVLFFTPFGSWDVHNQLDVVVAEAMRERGHDVTFVTCDGFYQPCSITRDKQNCTVCSQTMFNTMAPFDLRSIPLSMLIEPSNILKADDWVASQADDTLSRADCDGLQVGSWALSTVMTQFRVSEIGQINDARILSVHRRFLRDTLLTYWSIERLIHERNIDCIFIFNARFYPYRAAFEAAKRHGVRILVHERGFVANTFSFFENEDCLGQDTARAICADWNDTPLAEAELRQEDLFFSQKLLGIHGSWPSFYKPMDEISVRRLLGLPDDALLVGFFPTSPDEIVSFSRYKGADRQFDLIETIANSLPTPKHYLIVRHHPNMGGGNDSPVETTSFYEGYRRALSRKANVRIIMPKDKISSYALFPHIIAAIAPFSTLGYEAIAFGIPTLVSDGSEAAFDPEHTLIDWSPATISDRVRFITSPDAKLSRDFLRRFNRHVYNTLFRSSVKFDIVGIKDYFFPSLATADRDVLLRGDDKMLDRVCNYLAEGTHVHPRPDSASRSRSDADENDYIDGQLKTFAQRLEVSSKSKLKDGGAPKRLAILLDGSVATKAATSWQGAARSNGITMTCFDPTTSRGPFASLLDRLRFSFKRNEEERAFATWAYGARHALRDIQEAYILVTSARFQFHDSSLATIEMVLEATASSNVPLVPMAGWFRDPTALHPLRIQLSKLERPEWNDLRYRTQLRIQDILSLAVVRRDWLLKNLRSAEQFEAAIMEATSRIENAFEIDEPVFLWQ